MATTDLRFDVSAFETAARVFTRLGQVVERFDKRLDRLDGKKVSIEAEVKTEKAEREIGRFATDARRRLTAALSNLPDVEINGDSSDLDKDLARVKGELAELNGKEIGVDIDAADFDRETRRIRDELARIARESPDIRVQTDTAAAIAALKVVDAEADRLDGRNVKIKVDVDKSLSDSLIKVAQLGRALGALALPAAAIAAAPQLASIGAAAVTASGALWLIPAAGAAAGVAVGALALGFSNLGDALGDGEKAAEAFEKLSRNGKELVTTLRGLSPAWTTLRQSVQDAFLDKAGDAIRQLAGNYLPSLKANLTGVAAGFNAAGLGVAKILNAPAVVKDLDGALGNAREGVVRMAGAFEPLTAAVVDLVSVGAERLPRLGQGFAEAADRFADFIDRARESGQLGEWIDNGIRAIGQLTSITGNAATALGGLFRAATASGADFLGTVDQATEKISAFINSAQGQDSISSLFRDIREGVQAAAPGAEALAKAVASVVKALGDAGVLKAAGGAFTAVAEAVAPMVEALGGAAPALAALLDVAAALAPVLVPVAVGLAAIKLASAGWQRAKEFPNWLLSVKAGSQEAIRNSDRLSAAMSGLQAPFVAAAGGVRAFRDEMALQNGLAAAQGQDIGRLGAAMAAFETSQVGAVAALRETRDQMRETYASTSKAVQDFAANAGQAANTASVALGDKLANAASKGVEGIIRIPGAVAEASRALSTGLQTAVLRAGLELESLPARAREAGSTIKTALGVAAIDAGEKLKQLGASARDTGNLIKTGIGVAAIDAAEKVRQLPAAAKDAAVTLRTAVGVAAIDAGERLKTLGTSAADAGRSMATGLRDGVTNAAAALRNLPTAAAEAGRSLASNLRDGAVQAGTAVRDGVRTATDAVRQLPSQLGEAARSAGQSVATGLRSIPDGIRSAFSTVGSAVDGGLQHLGRFASSAAGAASAAGQAITTGLSRGMSGLLGALGGPWGLLITAATVALGIVAGEQAKAEQAARDHQAAIDQLAGSLDKYSGAVTQATINEKASALAKDGTLEKVKALGISTQDYVRAALGEEGALQRVQQQLSQHTSGLIEASSAYKNGQRELSALGLSLSDLTSAAQGNQPAIDKVNNAIGRIPDLEAQQSVRALVDAMLDAGGASADLANELGISNGQLEKAQQQTKLAAEASNDFASKLDFLKGGLGGLKDGAAPTEALAKGMSSLATSAGEAATRAGETQSALYGVEAGAAAAGQSMQASRNAFVEAATGAGLSKEAAEALATQIGLIPAAAETNFRTNATGVSAELGTLKAQFDAVPGEKTVTVQTLSDEAQQRLRDLGFEVTVLPDNKGITVTATTDQARANLAAIQADANAAVATMKIDADATAATGKTTAAVTFANGSTGTITLDGNNAPASAVINGTKYTIDTTTGTMTIDGNPAPGQADLSGLKVAVDRTTGTLTILGRDGGVASLKANLSQPSSSTHTIYVRYVDSGGLARQQNFAIGTGSAGRAAGAYTKPLPGTAYAGGGYRPAREMSAARAEMVPARHLRWIGDRMEGDEAFIPVNRSARSRSILARTAAEMGFDLMPRNMSRGSGDVAAQLRSALSTPRPAFPPITVQGGGGADMSGVEGLLRLLRGDTIAGSQYGPAMIEALGSIVTELRRRGSAAVATQSARAVSAGGAF